MSLFLRRVKDPDFEMKVEIKNNKDDNTLIHSVIDIWKQERGFTKKGSTEIKSRNKMRRVCEEDEYYLDEDCTLKRYSKHRDKYESLSLQVTILDSRETLFRWCKGYGDYYMPRIDTLLWHITVRSSTMNLHMK